MVAAVGPLHRQTRQLRGRAAQTGSTRCAETRHKTPAGVTERHVQVCYGDEWLTRASSRRLELA